MEIDVQVEKPTKVVRKLSIRVPAGTIDQEYQKRLEEVGKTAKLKGFRPGKIPMGVVERYYGSDVRHRLLSSLIDESYREAIVKTKIRPVSRPKVESKDEHSLHPEKGKDLSFTVTVEVLPEFKVDQYKGLSATRPKVEVKDKEVDTVIDQFRNSQGQLVGVSEAEHEKGRKIKKGDFVDFQYDGVLFVDGKPEKKEGLSGTRVIEIGSNQLIPGFEEELTGLKRGEGKKFKIQFPQEYSEKDFAGKDAEFEVKINEIKVKELPEVNDEFAHSVNYKDLLEMRLKIRGSLEKNKEREADQAMENEILKALIKKNPIDVPQSMIQAQAEKLTQNLQENLKSQNFSDEMIKEAIEKEKKNILQQADQQVRAGLLLETIAQMEKIKVESKDLDEEYEQIAQSMNTKAPQVKDYYEKNPEYRENLEFRLVEKKALKFLASQAKIKQK